MDADRSDQAVQAKVVLSTHSDVAAARALARELVERRLVACVNVVEGALSVYRWQGVVEEAREVLLVIKTSAARLAELEQAFAQLHSFDTPEWIVLSPEHVAPRYLEWLREQTR